MKNKSKATYSCVGCGFSTTSDFLGVKRIKSRVTRCPKCRRFVLTKTKQ